MSKHFLALTLEITAEDERTARVVAQNYSNALETLLPRESATTVLADSETKAAFKLVESVQYANLATVIRAALEDVIGGITLDKGVKAVVAALKG